MGLPRLPDLASYLLLPFPPPDTLCSASAVRRNFFVLLPFFVVCVARGLAGRRGPRVSLHRGGVVAYRVLCVGPETAGPGGVTAGHESLTRLADYRDFFALCDGVSSLCAAGGAFPMAQTGPPLARADT